MTTAAERRLQSCLLCGTQGSGQRSQRGQGTSCCAAGPVRAAVAAVATSGSLQREPLIAAAWCRSARAFQRCNSGQRPVMQAQLVGGVHCSHQGGSTALFSRLLSQNRAGFETRTPDAHQEAIDCSPIALMPSHTSHIAAHREPERTFVACCSSLARSTASIAVFFHPSSPLQRLVAPARATALNQLQGARQLLGSCSG
jgi:hypothetical protein